MGDLKNGKGYTTDPDELESKKTDLKIRSMLIAFYTETERLSKKQHDIDETLRTITPKRTWQIVDNVITKAAIITLFILMLFTKGCL